MSLTADRFFMELALELAPDPKLQPALRAWLPQWSCSGLNKTSSYWKHHTELVAGRTRRC